MRLNLPYAEVFYVNIFCAIPTECNNWPSPRYNLICRTSTFVAFISPTTSVYVLIYLNPCVIVFFVNPVLKFYHCLSILLEVIHHKFVPYPSSLQRINNLGEFCKGIATRMPLFFRKVGLTIIS